MNTPFIASVVRASNLSGASIELGFIKLHTPYRYKVHPKLYSDWSMCTVLKITNGWRTINSLVHKIRLHGRRGKGMAESFSREKLRHAPQKEGG